MTISTVARKDLAASAKLKKAVLISVQCLQSSKVGGWKACCPRQIVFSSSPAPSRRAKPRWNDWLRIVGAQCRRPCINFYPCTFPSKEKLLIQRSTYGVCPEVIGTSMPSTYKTLHVVGEKTDGNGLGRRRPYAYSFFPSSFSCFSCFSFLSL